MQLSELQNYGKICNKVVTWGRLLARTIGVFRVMKPHGDIVEVEQSVYKALKKWKGLLAIRVQKTIYVFIVAQKWLNVSKLHKTFTKQAHINYQLISTVGNYTLLRLVQKRELRQKESIRGYSLQLPSLCWCLPSAKFRNRCQR